MEKITTDISSFENLRKGGYAYVDKTDLVTSASALAAFFEGLAEARGEFVVLVDEYDVPMQGFFGDRKSLMYQSGYLTIKGLSKTEVDEIGNPKLVLGAPNHEVRGAIRAGWFNGFLKVPADDFDALVDTAKRNIDEPLFAAMR